MISVHSSANRLKALQRLRELNAKQLQFEEQQMTDMRREQLAQRRMAEKAQEGDSGAWWKRGLAGAVTGGTTGFLASGFNPIGAAVGAAGGFAGGAVSGLMQKDPYLSQAAMSAGQAAGGAYGAYQGRQADAQYRQDVLRALQAGRSQPARPGTDLDVMYPGAGDIGQFDSWSMAPEPVPSASFGSPGYYDVSPVRLSPAR